jgi:hypothetical protein
VPEALIELPSRTVMPHLFTGRALTTHTTIFRMYWAARCRHYRGRPVLLVFELAKQIVYFMYSRMRRVIQRLVRKFRVILSASEAAS